MTGGLSCAHVPRPQGPLRRRHRPVRPCCFTTSECPFGPAVTEASSHATSLDRVTGAFFYHPLTQLHRHVIHILTCHDPGIQYERRHFAPAPAARSPVPPPAATPCPRFVRCPQRAAVASPEPDGARYCQRCVAVAGTGQAPQDGVR